MENGPTIDAEVGLRISVSIVGLVLVAQSDSESVVLDLGIAAVAVCAESGVDRSKRIGDGLLREVLAGLSIQGHFCFRFALSRYRYF